MIRLYNISTGWLGRKQEDSEHLTVKEGHVKLTVVENVKPEFNPETQYLEQYEIIDVEDATWTLLFVIEDYTAEQLEQRLLQQLEALESEIDFQAVKSLLKTDEVTIHNVAQQATFQDVWKPGLLLEANKHYKYIDGHVYRSLVAQTAFMHFLPPDTPTTYFRIRPIGVYLPWQQPLGAHDTYQVDEVCTHNGFRWINTSPNNAFAPGVFGWTNQGPE